MLQYQSLENDNKLNANIRSLNAKKLQVFEFNYSWTKETVKQKGSITQKFFCLGKVELKKII